MKRWLGVVAVCTVIIAAFISSDILGAKKDRYSNLELFARVLNLAQQYYVDEVDTKKLIYGAVKGMLKELDPHTNFLQPQIFKDFESETAGEFGGLGIEITVKDGILTVISPIEDTPAWKAGVKAGDKIVEINGVSTKGYSLVEAAQQMRGKKGSKVVLGIFRDGFEKPKDFAVVRATVKIKSVKTTDLENGYLYLRLTSFIENSTKEFKKALAKHIKKHKQVRGLIIDLRKNPGGLLDQAIKISDLFLSKGIIVSTIGRNRKDKEVTYATNNSTEKNYPIVVVVDEYSASASEILAGALQDNKRALILGQPTFGKGSVQSVVKLGDGSGLKLTVARYYTPSGKSIQALGIVPDLFVDNVDSELFNKAIVSRRVKREADIKGHLEAEKDKVKKPKSTELSFWWLKKDKDRKLTKKEKLLKTDFQLLQAYNTLKAWKVFDSVQSGE